MSTKPNTQPVEEFVVEPALLGNVLRKDAARRALVKSYTAEEKITVTISPMYAKYFGNVTQISIQGIPVFIPTDGGYYRIPKSHAALLFESIRKVDEQVRRTNRMSNVQQNLEPSIGAMRF